ncbi:hypothetical protein ACEVG1_07400 [Parapedobacter sp. 2B3]
MDVGALSFLRWHTLILKKNRRLAQIFFCASGVPEVANIGYPYTYVGQFLYSHQAKFGDLYAHASRRIAPVYRRFGLGLFWDTEL